LNRANPSKSSEIFKRIPETLRLKLKRLGVAVPETLKEVETTMDACKLVDVGFEYVCEIDGEKIFRKRK
jgi:hypothetical protein